MKKNNRPIPQIAQRGPFNKRDAHLLLVVLGVSVFLNVLGFGWGMDGYVPWSPDAIEGVTVVREMPRLFGEWTYKYPRLQFLIDGLCYKPLMQSWENNKVSVQYNGEVHESVLTPERLRTLAAVSRVNILIMSGLIITLVYLIARFYYADSISAFFASLSLAACLVFVYYSHTSCIDIPSMFWMTAGVYFLLKSVDDGKMFHHVLMGLTLAFACCTKDPMLFYAVAFVFTYLILRIRRLRKEGQDYRECLIALLNKNSWLAAGVFLFTFALLQGILFSPQAYWDRMGVWVGGRGVVNFNQGFGGQVPLLIVTLKDFYWAMGWPLAILFILSVLFTSRKHLLFNLTMVVLPLVFFYIAVSMRIKMSYIRYYLPVMGLFCLPIGAFVAQLWTLKAKSLRRVSLVLVWGCYLLSIMYCFALDMEMIYDTRNQAAEWIHHRLPKNTQILSLIRGPYGPNLSKYDYPTIEDWTVPPLQVLLEHRRTLPDYILVSYGWLTIMTKEGGEYRQALLEGKAGYSKAASFTTKGFIFPRKNPLSIAAWPLVPHCEEISPPITLMKKNPVE
jgi:hypothetical protein